MLAGGHCDKKPLLLVATCSTSLQGPTKTRYRSKLVNGQIQRATFTLDQPMMHALYRQHFNAVDQFNRLATGPRNVTEIWHTKNVWDRLFAATLAMVEVNAFLAYTQHCGAEAKKMTRHQWRLSLSSGLILNKYLVQNSVLPCSPALAARGEKSHMYMVPLGKQLRCQHCTKRTSLACACGDAVCNPSTGRTCFATHVLEAQQGKLSARWKLHSRLTEHDQNDDDGSCTFKKRRSGSKTPAASQSVHRAGSGQSVRRCLQGSLS